ncbi:TPA: hypothetical protein DCZ15_00945 [Candidatus Falkowbacteria bacterium]|nr:MAG: polymerase III, subunit gamma and tau protein [Candidatus Falkowbacteria bacterium GW2011_GWF2_43_32]HBA36422.1 hypothetical protein [Candidatus Falkowbacteria bacterium]
MSTLYRDYRPQNFSEVLGQNHIKITVQNEISAGRLANAYLFCGPRAVGKTTLARVLAKAVNCENKKDGEYEPCNKCASCRSITAGRHMDIVEIDAASNTGVDNVRENIIAFSRLTPSGAKFKVFIIDEVHMLSLSAFNALLKIIEEPPSYVIFVLCTTEVQKVPGTIISRCERFDFKRISINEIVKKLSYISVQEKMEIDQEVLEAVARRSGGHLRDAESLLGQIFSLGDKKITTEQAELVIPHYNSNEAVDLLDHLSRKDAAKAIALINNLTDSGVNVKVFTGEIISILRKVMLNKLSPELADNLGLDFGESLEKRLSQAADTLKWEQLTLFTRRFLEASSDNKNPLIPQLPLELAVVELCFGLPATGLSGPSAPTAGSSVVNRLKEVAPNSPLIKDRPAPAPLAAQNARPDVVKVGAVKKNATVVNLSAEELASKWPEFLVKIKKHNHSLSFIMQNCEPRSVNGGQICLVFKYKFHQDRINDAGIKSIVENTLAEVYGDGLMFHSEIDENLEIKKEEKIAITEKEETEAAVVKNDSQATPGLVNNLLKAFGGELVN